MRAFLIALVVLAGLAVVAFGGWWLGRQDGSPLALRTADQDGSAGTAGIGATAAIRRSPVARDRIVSLGRIRPTTRVRVAGPARPSVVIGKLLADQGDRVTAGQEIARLDSVPTEEAEVEVARVEIADADRDLLRAKNLVAEGVSSRSVLDQAISRRERAGARLVQAQAELGRSHVRAPITGVVLEVFARDGERVGPEGIVELADTSRMLAVAEVPESDIPAVRLGQPAKVTSQTLPGGELAGKVARIGGKVQEQQVVSADPVADLDARVVEVEVELADPAKVAGLTNLRVEVEIDVAGEASPP